MSRDKRIYRGIHALKAVFIAYFILIFIIGKDRGSGFIFIFALLLLAAGSLIRSISKPRMVFTAVSKPEFFFKVVRNPYESGYAVQMLSALLFMPTVISALFMFSLIIIMFFVIFLQKDSLYKERFPAYNTYKLSVPFLFPNFTVGIGDFLRRENEVSLLSTGEFLASLLPLIVVCLLRTGLKETVSEFIKGLFG